MRNRSSKKLSRPIDYQAMGAQTVEDLMPEPRSWEQWMRISGKHQAPNVQEFVLNFGLEFIGSFLLAVIATMVRASAATGNVILNGFLVGVAIGGTHWVVTRWAANYALRRHLNWIISLAYLLVGEIGLPGFLMYSAVQTLGALAGGAFAGGLPALLAGSATPIITGATIVGATVPVPTTLISTCAYALGLEFLGAFVIVFTLLFNEFYATDTDSMSLMTSYRHANTIVAGTIVALTTALFQVQSYTWGNVTYLGGLFAGFNKDGIRDILTASNLAAIDVADTVYTIQTSGAAWANYVFMPLLGAGAAAAVFWLFFEMYVNRESDILNTKVNVTQMPRETGGNDAVMPAMSPVSSQYIQHVKPSAVQSPVSALKLPYGKTH